ncbi:MAG: hypothetical protein HGB11_13730 [Chlorobiales bacterium]|nr:hypothetical protein [Chlorobiales bacterium]
MALVRDFTVMHLEQGIAIMVDWEKIDNMLKVASPFILTVDERKRVAALEQEAYERNLPRIHELLEAHQTKLQERKFWTKLQADTKGLRFLYSLHGFYGPGGFNSQLHVAGSLVLATIRPKGDALAGFYLNDLEQNVFLGERFDEIAFMDYVSQDLMRYLAPENQILSVEQYEWIQKLLEDK